MVFDFRVLRLLPGSGCFLLQDLRVWRVWASGLYALRVLVAKGFGLRVHRAPGDASDFSVFRASSCRLGAEGFGGSLVILSIAGVSFRVLKHFITWGRPEPEESHRIS